MESWSRLVAYCIMILIIRHRKANGRTESLNRIIENDRNANNSIIIMTEAE